MRNLETRVAALEAKAPDGSHAIAVALTSGAWSARQMREAEAAAIEAWEAGHKRAFPENGRVMRVVLCGVEGRGGV